MLTLRKRGRKFHVRGTVRVGRKTRVVAEHSTGSDRRDTAEEYRSRLEHEIRQELLHGAEGRVALMTVADALNSYIARPERLHRNDLWRVRELNEVMGDHAIVDSVNGWNEFMKSRCSELAPATIDRFRATLQAALNHAARALQVAVPKIPAIRFSNHRLCYLTREDADALHGAYVEHVRPIISVLRYQGARTQEALQLQWGAVNFRKGMLFFDRTKSGVPRTVPMHPVVLRDIEAIWNDREGPKMGHVFLNRLGEPYADTRDYKFPGGNPLASSHRTALRRVRIAPNGTDNFRIHDWRHHWASTLRMNGVDLLDIKELGGWSSLRMVERYATVSAEHLADAIRKTG